MGGELREPIKVEGTTFQLVSDYEGGWVIVLHSESSKTRLSPGGWIAQTGFLGSESGAQKAWSARWPRRSSIRAALLQMGLEEGEPQLQG